MKKLSNAETTTLSRLYYPHTSLGRVTAGLIAILIILMPVFTVVGKSVGIGPNESLFDYPALIALTWVALVTWIASSVTGVLAVWKQKERAYIVTVGTMFNLLVLVIILGAILTD